MAGFVLLMAIGVLIPASRTARESFLFSKIDKDSLLKNTPSPRIVLVGGSNTSFSIDSQILKDSLHLNPVNTRIISVTSRRRSPARGQCCSTMPPSHPPVHPG